MTDLIPCACCGTALSEDDCTDTTTSNVNTARAYAGQHTGDIYRCPKCDELTIDDFLSGEIRAWAY